MSRALLAVVLVLACFCAPFRVASQPAKLSYPTPPTDQTVDDYYGTKVPDPYRPLESIDSPQTRTWLEAEASLSRSYLDAIPQRAAIRAHLQSIVNYERWTVPFHMRDQYFYLYNSGLQNQYVLYTMRGINGTPRVLIDPNALSKDGSVTISNEQPSWNAKLLAYSTQTSGSDWLTWHVRDVATGKDLPDTLQWSKFSTAGWLPDDSGFYYERYPAPSSGQAYKASLASQQVYLHRLGTPQSADTLVYYRPDHTNWLYGTSVSEDGRYLVVSTQSNDSINDRIGYLDLRERNPKLHELLWKNDAQWGYITNVGTRFYFTTTLHAQNSRVVAIDLRRPQTIATIVPASKWALQSATAVAHRLVLNYLADAHSAVKVYDLAGRFVRDVALPGLGTATGFGGYLGDRTTFYSYSGYTAPPGLYLYDVVTGKRTAYRKTHIAFDAAKYTTEEVFYTSKDGTRVPMMISYRKGLVRDGSNPTLLYAYGGFDIPMTPYFSSFNATWMQMGGIYAVPNIRGGSEYGEAWHHAGMLAHKQNVFDDFIAAARYLIAQKYTSTPKLAIRGDSNGGLLMGAVETQRPHLFGAVLVGVGVLDMLRYDKFTIGSFWASEYGSATCAPKQDPSTCGEAAFKWLYAYSPYANIKPGTAYPPTLIVTSDHDDRVFPAHSFKYAARLQAAQAGTAPVLLRVQLRAGHGESTTLAQSLDLTADLYAFLVKNLGMTVPAWGRAQ